MRLTFGRYIPLGSPIHKMDPRLKMFIFIALITTIFFRNGYSGYVFIGIIILTLFFISRLPYSILYRLLKPISVMVVFLFIINCFLLKDPALHLGAHWGADRGGVSWFVVSERALYQTLYLGLRIYFLIILTTILTGTTQPLDLTIALEDLMTPLKLIRFPVHIIATIIAIALRMIPTLIEEAGRIMKAQASRGIDFRNGKAKEKVKASVSLVIPLLVSAFQKAEDLAYAMDARGYNPKQKRTRYRKFEFRALDFTIFFTIFWLIVFFFCQIYLGFIPSKYTLQYLDHFIL